MSSTSSTSNVGAYLTTDNLRKFVPEPKSGSGLGFSELFRKLSNPLSAVPSLLDPTFASLLNKQLEVQMQMQLVSMESNIEKSRHEIQMAPIRNIRVG